MQLYVAAGERGKGVAMEQVGSWSLALLYATKGAAFFRNDRSLSEMKARDA